jgi:hypothetical protein
MKINDVIAEAGILGSIGRGLAGAATGAVRMLDRAAGGTGMDVGTAAQQAAYANKMQKTQYAKARADVAGTAFTEFSNALKQNKINLQDPRSYDPATVIDYLKSFTEDYFSVGDQYHNTAQSNAIKLGVLQALSQIPLPTTINNISVQDYLEKANMARTSIINQVDRMMSTKQAAQADSQQTTQQTTQQQTTQQQPTQAAAPLPTDVTVVSSSPLVLRYRNQDFALTDSDRWVRFGSNKLASPEMEAFLTRQLEKL